MPRLILGFLVAGVVVAGVPAIGAAAPSARTLVPQKSIRSVQLRMSPAEVRAALGRAPDAGATTPHPILGKVRVWRFGALRITFDGTGAGRSVVTVTTTSTRDRSGTGVGVGSSEAEVRRLVSGSRCAIQYGYRHCWVGVQRAGRILTDFSINRRGRVTRVTLGRVLD